MIWNESIHHIRVFRSQLPVAASFQSRHVNYRHVKQMWTVNQTPNQIQSGHSLGGGTLLLSQALGRQSRALIEQQAQKKQLWITLAFWVQNGSTKQRRHWHFISFLGISWGFSKLFIFEPMYLFVEEKLCKLVGQGLEMMHSLRRGSWKITSPRPKDSVPCWNLNWLWINMDQYLWKYHF